MKLSSMKCILTTLFFFGGGGGGVGYSHCKLKNVLLGCREGPVCFCGFHNETVKHFFLECPLHSASRTNPLSSAARIFADRWSSMSKEQTLPVFLFGSPLLSLEQNNDLLFHVQCFISVRFYKSSFKKNMYFPPASIPLISSLFCFRFD